MRTLDTVTQVGASVDDDASIDSQQKAGGHNLTTTASRVVYEVVASEGVPDEYRVEGIDHDRDGIIYVTIFSGPDAETRAREYARFKNGQPQAR